METVVLVLLLVIAALVLVILVRSIRIVPQQQVYIIERLGRYSRSLNPGLNLLVPFVDVVREKVDLREQVVSFPPQPVITSDNLVVSIDTVLYHVVTDPRLAVYAIRDFLQAIEQLTVTTLRNVIGSLDLEKALTSRDDINRQLRGVLDETTGKWGIRVTRVEIKAIEPPPSVRDSMEKQMRAERDRRAAILQAEGHKQAQILTAEGDKQGAILRAQGSREAQVLHAEGQAKAIRTVADAIHRANPDPKLLAYQYIQALPAIAQGESNKLWIIPSELTRALDGIGGVIGRLQEQPREASVSGEEAEELAKIGAEAQAAAEAAQREAETAVREAEQAVPGQLSEAVTVGPGPGQQIQLTGGASSAAQRGYSTPQPGPEAPQADREPDSGSTS
ncbi:MAG TPA: SPFH domain-containing protein [Micromonosporaceae bacterium]|nr:SPFH domain-containing protein [Micromonosporaceae bacterium]